MATANPVMNVDVYRRAGMAESEAQTMTVQGTVSKTALLVIILLVTASITWWQATTQETAGMAYGLAIAGGIGGFILAMITAFKPNVSPYTSPFYAACEGLFLGAISASFEGRFPGIVANAVALTIGVLMTMLALYGTGIIRATEKFKMGVVAATGAVCLVYLVDIVASMFNHPIGFIHQGGAIGIGFSAIVVVIAALNLILDFDFIEKGAQMQAPKYMEWYGGFSLLVTLVWMYLEILRLLSKLQSRN